MIELAIGIAALLALVSWAVRRARRGPPSPPRERHPGIDLEELEAAELEARDAGRAPSTSAARPSLHNTTFEIFSTRVRFCGASGRRMHLSMGCPP